MRFISLAIREMWKKGWKYLRNVENLCRNIPVWRKRRKHWYGCLHLLWENNGEIIGFEKHIHLDYEKKHAIILRAFYLRDIMKTAKLILVVL